MLIDKSFEDGPGVQLLSTALRVFGSETMRSRLTDCNIVKDEKWYVVWFKSRM